MQLNISNKLRQQLAELSDSQLEHLVKQAEHLRSRSGSQSGPLDAWIMRAIKKERRAAEMALDQMDGTVASVLAREVLVEVDSYPATKCLAGAHQLVVGDQVRIGQVGGQWVVVSVHPRRTKLSRAEIVTGNDQLVVANVDIVAIVVSVVSPPLHPRIIDRYLVAIQRGGPQAVLCVNKVDLLTDATELEKLAPYERAGVPVFRCSAANGDGVQAFREYVRGSMVAFVGHSGVGKSSLINRFAPELNLATGAVSEGYGRGTHTTTTSSLHRLDGGTTLVDTPGIRSFGLGEIDESDILAAFPEFQGYSCRFSDCKHLEEPGCGIWDAVESGEIAEERYWTYRKLLEP